jgi:hypothetical protein
METRASLPMELLSGWHGSEHQKGIGLVHLQQQELPLE